VHGEDVAAQYHGHAGAELQLDAVQAPINGGRWPPTWRLAALEPQGTSLPRRPRQAPPSPAGAVL